MPSPHERDYFPWGRSCYVGAADFLRRDRLHWRQQDTAEGRCRLAPLLDFGTNFKAEGAYFDEFLGPRDIFGFSDLLALGLLPPLKGFYRRGQEYSGGWERQAGHPLFSEVDLQAVLRARQRPYHVFGGAELSAEAAVFWMRCGGLSVSIFIAPIMVIESSAFMVEFAGQRW